MFEMTDIDAGSVLLPVSEEPTLSCLSLPNTPDSAVVDAIDSQQHKLPDSEDQAGTSVRSTYLDEVREELRQIREHDTQKKLRQIHEHDTQKT